MPTERELKALNLVSNDISFSQVDYKRMSKRGEIVANLRSFIAFLALANIVLLPFIFLWQIIYAAYSYVGLIKKNPETFSLRRWSLYGRQYLRYSLLVLEPLCL